jgi:site-specific DNA-methyltransferase (adenine-specific)
VTSAPSPPAESRGSVTVHHGDNIDVLRRFADASFTLIYLDPPFNTGRMRERAVEHARSTLPAPALPASPASPDSAKEHLGAEDAGSTPALGAQKHSRGTGEPGTGQRGTAPRGTARQDTARQDTARQETARREAAPGAGAGGVVRRGFHGREYERLRGDLRTYDDRFDDYWGFLEPRLEEAWRLLAADGTLYLHLDFREAHYAKVLMDALFGRDKFLNELIWAYDYGAKTRRRWPTKHDTILVYVKNPDRYWFDSDAVDREPYMAPGLVTPEKAERGKLPTDVWWHTIVPTTGREKTGYPTQKPEGILRRIIQASSRPGDHVLDFFAGSGTTGAVAQALGRHAVLVDDNPAAIEVMRRRMPTASVVSDELGSAEETPVPVVEALP